MAKIDLPTNYTSNIWASAGDVVEPTDTKKQQGWIAEIPPYQFENWLNFTNQTAIAHIVQHGISEWDANTEYQAGKSYVQDEDGVIYKALTTNTGNNPKSDQEQNWTQPFDFNNLKELATETASGVARKGTQEDFDGGTPGSIFIPANILRNAFDNLNATNITSGLVDGLFLPIPTTDKKGAVKKARSQDITNGTGEDRYVNPVQLKTVSDDIKSTTAGVALSGEPVITAGTVENYQITNFSSFDTYSVSVDFEVGATGSVSITDDIVSVTVDGGSTGGLVLTVTKSGVDYDFGISIGDSRVNKPTITFPSDGSTAIATNVTFTTTSFKTTPSDFGDTHASSDWEVASDSGFSTIVASATDDTLNLEQWQVSPELSPGTVYYVRARHTGTSLGDSAWSSAVQFTTANAPNTPTITSPVDGATDIGETPTITTSAFSSPVGETHQATDWEIRLNSNDSLVWSDYNNTSDLTSITVPSGQLAESTEYKIRVRHIGSQLGESAWGTSTFTTEAQFFVFDPSNAGEPFGGGYYAGANIVVGGTTYALVVAPKAQGGEAASTLPWEWTTDPDVPGAESTNDGASNTAAIVAAGGSSTSVAAGFCNNLSVNGYSDWHLPSIDELEICYRYLKPTTQDTFVDSSNPHGTATQSNPNSDPVLVSGEYSSSYPTQTSITIYQESGAEAFVASDYWSSTQVSSGPVWSQNFSNGSQSAFSSLLNSNSVRAVRWVAV